MYCRIFEGKQQTKDSSLPEGVRLVKQDKYQSERRLKKNICCKVSNSCRLCQTNRFCFSKIPRLMCATFTPQNFFTPIFRATFFPSEKLLTCSTWDKFNNRSADSKAHILSFELFYKPVCTWCCYPAKISTFLNKFQCNCRQKAAFSLKVSVCFFNSRHCTCKCSQFTA